MRDENNKAIVVQEAYSILNNLKCVIKKTVQTSSGKDVMLCSFKNGVDEKSGKQVKDILFSFGENYIVQELIEQSSQLSIIYDKSVSTFRIMMYRINDSIYHCPPVLRIGQSVWFPQFANGEPLFGQNTASMLQYIANKKR